MDMRERKFTEKQKELKERDIEDMIDARVDRILGDKPSPRIRQFQHRDKEGHERKGSRSSEHKEIAEQQKEKI